MASYKLLLLAGDGIGPEVMAEVKRLLALYGKTGTADFDIEEDLVGLPSQASALSNRSAVEP